MVSTWRHLDIVSGLVPSPGVSWRGQRHAESFWEWSRPPSLDLRPRLGERRTHQLVHDVRHVRQHQFPLDRSRIARLQHHHVHHQTGRTPCYALQGSQNAVHVAPLLRRRRAVDPGADFGGWVVFVGFLAAGELQGELGMVECGTPVEGFGRPFSGGFEASEVHQAVWGLEAFGVESDVESGQDVGDVEEDRAEVGVVEAGSPDVAVEFEVDAGSLGAGDLGAFGELAAFESKSGAGGRFDVEVGGDRIDGWSSPQNLSASSAGPHRLRS